MRIGELGAVRFGLTKDEVRELLGEPEGVGWKGQIWVYGSLEISFFEGVVALIAVALWDGPVRFPPPLEVELGPLAPGARLPNVRDALEAAEIPCVLAEDRGDEEAAVLVAGRAEITFHAGRLDEMIASAPTQA